MSKSIKVKPQFYANCFEQLKTIAHQFGYNLVIHGSMDRDMDLVAIPWATLVKPHTDMLDALVAYLGGHINPESEKSRKLFAERHHGRMNYIINLNRGGPQSNYDDPQWYIDISIMPPTRTYS